uniref:Uncharacterized protein n=1 Tax=Anopheles arabiensis TaxID=7173 RepID=A0A8W7MT92_ANOAR
MLSPAILYILHESNRALTITAICQHLKHHFPDVVPSEVSLRTAVIESVLQSCDFGFILYDHRNHGYKLAYRWQTKETVQFEAQLRHVLSEWKKPIRKKQYKLLKLSNGN